MRPVDAVLKELRAHADHRNVDGQARFGITGGNRIGVSVTTLRAIGKPHRRDHQLALDLWQTGVHEARMLAAIIDDPTKVTKAQMELWARNFDSWDIVDNCCWGLFDRTPYARAKIDVWTHRRAEFVKRGGFALIAGLAVHDKALSDDVFIDLLEPIEREAGDDRNFVRKAVNWALREIGKRNLSLNAVALDAGGRIRAQGTRSARWIAADALRELRSDAVQARLH